MQRLTVSYQLTCEADESPRQKALEIALEQTVELPAKAVPPAIAERMVGRIEHVGPLSRNRCEAIISYPLEAIGGEPTQCLNVLFGNISLKTGIRIQGIEWPAELLRAFGGPGHGIEGIRAAVGAPRGPLLCSALKPMGLSARALAEYGEAFARGGVHIIKDDHGLADQPDAPFEERLLRCQEAIERANAATGGRSLYFPNVSAGYAELPKRVEAARRAGCRGVLINAWITGLDAVRHIRDHYGMIVMAHPAMTGAYFGLGHGIAPELLLGELFRLAGADASIYPNAGGRFGFTVETCEAINAALRRETPGIRPAFPTPGGGMDVRRAPDWIRRYGPDTIVLIGGSLYQQGDLEAASRALAEAIAHA